MKERRMLFGWLIIVLLVLVFFTTPTFAGNLEPSAPPGSTMKTLDEVEPRIPIKGLPFTISNPGSYYLTQDLRAPAPGVGIIVHTDNVTIDLMGFSLIGPDSGSPYGIHLVGHANIEIRNGTVRDFGGFGIYANISSKQNRVINVRALSNGSTGIHLQGNSNLIKDCTASENNGNGIWAGNGSTVTGNTACNNQYDGISTNRGCTVTGNTAYNNQESGIYASDGSTVIGNTVWYNNQSDNAINGGIRVQYACLVKNNTATANKQNNIYVYGYDNVVEENLVTGSTNGIYFLITGNFYANNRASGNATNYAGSVPTGYGDGGGNVSF